MFHEIPLKIDVLKVDKGKSKKSKKKQTTDKVSSGVFLVPGLSEALALLE